MRYRYSQTNSSKLRIFVGAAALIGSLLVADINTASAELPTNEGIRCRYSATTRTGRRIDSARHLVTFDLNTVLGLGESCSVTHSVCGSRFIPLSQLGGNDNRRCIDFTNIGTSLLGAGDDKARVRTRSKVLTETRRGAGRQMTYGATASCTDGTETRILSCSPRARKLSINGGRGTSIRRAVRQMARNFAG